MGVCLAAVAQRHRRRCSTSCSPCYVQTSFVLVGGAGKCAEMFKTFFQTTNTLTLTIVTILSIIVHAQLQHRRYKGVYRHDIVICIIIYYSCYVSSTCRTNLLENEKINLKKLVLPTANAVHHTCIGRYIRSTQK